MFLDLRGLTITLRLVHVILELNRLNQNIHYIHWSQLLLLK